jgi:hypothetical protein
MTHASVATHPLSFKLGTGFWNAVPPELISPLTDKFTSQARCALEERDLVEPDAEHLTLIAMAAAESVCLLHDAALNPTQADLDHHFSDFVVRAVTGSLSQ